MRTLHLISAIVVVSVAAGMACQKAKVVPAPASITIVHAMADGNAIVPKFGTDTTGRYYQGPTGGNTMIQVNYGTSQLYSRVAGDNSLLIVPFTDTVFNIFNRSITLHSRD